MHVVQFGNDLLADRLASQFQVQDDGELRTLSLLAVYGDGSVHHIHDVLGDGHAQSGTLHAVHHRGLFPREGFEDVLLVLQAHANARVLDAELILGIALSRTGILYDAQAYRSACRSELDGIAQDVEQHLVQAQLIDHDILVQHVLRVDEEVQLLALHTAVNDGTEVVEHVGKPHLLLLQFGTPTLNAAHVQHIVDEREEVVARHRDFLQIVSHRLLVVDVRGSQRSEADDGIHGRTYVMAHAVEEGRLGLIGMVGHGQSLLEEQVVALHRLLLLDFLLLLAVHVENTQEAGRSQSVRTRLVQDKTHAHPSALLEAEVITQVELLAETFREGRRQQECRQPFRILRCEEPLGKNPAKFLQPGDAVEVHSLVLTILDDDAVPFPQVYLDDGNKYSTKCLDTFCHRWYSLWCGWMILRPLSFLQDVVQGLNELTGDERLGEVTRRTLQRGVGTMFKLREGSKHNDRQFLGIRVLTYGLQYFKPVHLGHHDVQEYGIRMLRGDFLQCLLARRSGNDIVVGEAEL